VNSELFPEPQLRYMTRALRLREVWVRPKPPSKRAGRQGTRRAWKQANPPYTKMVPDRMVAMSLSRKIVDLINRAF
jgi:hypothetical protein